MMYKRHIIRSSRNNSTIIYRYSFNDILLFSVNNIRDLGIIFSVLLITLYYHNELCSSNSLEISLPYFWKLFRRYQSFIALYSQIYVSQVWSATQYSFVIWCPYFKNHIASIEIIQHKFLRFASYYTDSLCLPIAIIMILLSYTCSPNILRMPNSHISAHCLFPILFFPYFLQVRDIPNIIRSK